MSDLIALAFDAERVRMILRNGEPWWVLIDVCRILDVKNPRDAANRLWNWQRDYVGISDAIGRQRKTIIVNEAGVYSLILASNKPIAESFARWLFSEVLPSIRKTGSYVTAERLAEVEKLTAPTPVPSRMGERFRVERDLFEARERLTLLSALKGTGMLSPAKLRSIEHHDTKIPEKLYVALDSFGFDMKFIRYGEPRLSTAERALCAAWHAGSAESRAAMLTIVAQSSRLLH